MRLFICEKKRLTLTMLGVAAMDEAAKKPIAKEMRFRIGADEGSGGNRVDKYLMLQLKKPRCYR